jgi:hypothetical protein
MTKAKSSPGAAAPTTFIAPQPVRDFLDRLDNCARSLEGLLELVTPYTLEEERKGYVPRNSVSWALTPLIESLRQAIDGGWALIIKGEQA